MAYVSYTGLETPNEVLEKMAEYVVTRGYTIVTNYNPLTGVYTEDDVSVFDQVSVDGKKFCWMNRSEDYYYIMRSANGINIFGTTDESEMDSTPADIDPSYYGIGAIASEGYSRSRRWYNQYNIPVNKGGKNAQAVYIPVPCRSTYLPSGEPNPDANTEKYTLYCNNIVTPADTLIFHVVAENIPIDPENCIGHNRRCVSLVFGDVYKYDVWNGGAYFSGSSTPALMKESFKLFTLQNTTFADEKEKKEEAERVRDAGILPILSSGTTSNTFLRIDIDDAPTDARQNIIWASSGSDNVTGKKLSLPVRVQGNGNGIIPHYYVMQSQSRIDSGRNINTLNGISLEMPLYMAVLVDPDILDNYAAVGQVIGVYYVCSLNMQTGFVYEQDYPNSNSLAQIFSFSMRRGRYGFDAYAVRQDIDDSDAVNGDVTVDTHHTYG